MFLRPLLPALFTTFLCAVAGADAGEQRPEAEPGSTAGRAAEHVVVAGDTLSELAQAHGVRLADLLALNRLRASDILREGQRLAIPSAPGNQELDPGQAQVGPPPAPVKKPVPDKKAVKDRDPPPGAGPETLEVSPTSTVYFYRPLGPNRFALMPVVVYLHGRGNDPAADCRRWAPIVRRQGWLVCPSGPEDRGSGRGWQSNWVLGKQIVMASIAALRQRFGRRVQLYGNTLVGFSEGAFVAMNIGVREPHTFNRWLILAASSTYWGGPGLEALAEARPELKRIFLITGAGDAVIPGTDDTLRRLRAARVVTRAATPEDMGHEVLLEKKATLYRAALQWLEKGKGAPRESYSEERVTVRPSKTLTAARATEARRQGT